MLKLLMNVSFLLSTIAAASIASACVPTARTCTTPSAIRLVGTLLGVPDRAAGQFTVVVRDGAMNPLQGASVVVDFSNLPDVSICGDQLDPDALVNTTYGTVRKFTGPDGSVTFTILGSGHAGALGTQNWAVCNIYANGSRIGTPTVSALDLDGSGGVGANDLGVWLAQFGLQNPAFTLADYDASGDVGANDLTVWLDYYGAGTSVETCGPARP